MRRISVIPVTVVALGLAACTTTRSDGSPKIQTSAEASKDSVEGAAQAPLRDLNVLRTKIPEVLLEAIADPYKRPAHNLRVGRAAQCAQLVILIKPLNDALGADFDTPAKDEDDLLGRGRATALGAAASVASDAIPFRGWVRKLSGAERHDRLVQQAIAAGAARRAYLKGLGEARGCDPPATPSHELTGSPVPSQEINFKPKYPIR
jgi:hypothetical protein